MKNKSIGHFHKSVAGKKFGMVALLRRVPDKIFKNGNNAVRYEGKCDCGITKIFYLSNINKAIKQKGAFSCGCINKKPYGIAAAKQVYLSCKKSAEKRGHVFNVSFERFIELSKEDCKYCGAKPNNTYENTHVKHNGNFIYNGLDRIDNNIGYELYNLVPCCWKCNNAKAQMSKEEFLAWIKKVFNHSIITAIV